MSEICPKDQLINEVTGLLPAHCPDCRNTIVTAFFEEPNKYVRIWDHRLMAIHDTSAVIGFMNEGLWPEGTVPIFPHSNHRVYDTEDDLWEDIDHNDDDFRWYSIIDLDQRTLVKVHHPPMDWMDKEAEEE